MSDDQTPTPPAGDDNTAPAAGAAGTYYVDEDTCIGCALCVSVCPNGYTMEANGKSVVTEDADHTDPAMEQALEACPVNAIHKK